MMDNLGWAIVVMPAIWAIGDLQKPDSRLRRLGRKIADRILSGGSRMMWP